MRNHLLDYSSQFSDCRYERELWNSSQNFPTMAHALGEMIEFSKTLHVIT